MKSKYFISIITVVYNSDNLIEETIKSITSCKTDQMEYIIIDGGSTDNTLNIIDKYKKKIDILISEEDKGIYDAMNKGINLANGLYVLNINAGDKLIISPFEYLTDEIIKEKYDLILFNVLLSTKKIFNCSVSPKIKFMNTIHHQGALYLNQSKKLYNINYKVFADFDFNQRLYKNKMKCLKIDNVLTFHDIGGISHEKNYFNETYKIINKNFNIYYCIIAYLYYKWMGLKKIIKNG